MREERLDQDGFSFFYSLGGPVNASYVVNKSARIPDLLPEMKLNEFMEFI